MDAGSLEKRTLLTGVKRGKRGGGGEGREEEGEAMGRVELKPPLPPSLGFSFCFPSLEGSVELNAAA